MLDVARGSGALIEERMGAEVIYTRTDDMSVPARRADRAGQRERRPTCSCRSTPTLRHPLGDRLGDLLPELHHFQGRLDVAARENASSQRSIYELQGLIEKIALKDKVDESREFAAKVQQRCSGSWPAPIPLPETAA